MGIKFTLSRVKRQGGIVETGEHLFVKHLANVDYLNAVECFKLALRRWRSARSGYKRLLYRQLLDVASDERQESFWRLVCASWWL
jgi:hypothetical protein